MKSNNLLQSLGFGVKQTIANIKGSTVKLGQKYQDATVVLYNKANLADSHIENLMKMVNISF